MRALGLVLALLLAAAAPAAAQSSPLVLADFDADPPALFPPAWESRDEGTARRVYKIVRDGGDQYLAAAAQAESAQIGLPVSLDLARYPVLSWRWRVAALPAGGNERRKATNDSAAGVYAVFRGGFGGLVPRAIKYVWSTEQPVGAAFASPGYSNAKIVVLRSGGAAGGEWRTERVDVAADYRRLFDEAPPALRGIAVLTDADDTGTRAAADYDDFRALPRPVQASADPAS